MKFARIAVLVLLALHPTPSRAAQADLPDEVRSALENNARSLTDLKILGVSSRRMLTPAAKALEAMKTLETEAEFTQPVKFELRLQGPKVYESFRYPPGLYKPADGLDEYSFDGTKYFTGSIDNTGPNQPATLIISAPAILQSERQVLAYEQANFLLWYLIEAGFSGPSHTAELGQPMQSLVLTRAAAGRIESVRETTQNSRKLLEVVVTYPEPWGSKAVAPVEKDDTLLGLRGDSKQQQMRIQRDRRGVAGQRRLCRFLLDAELGYAVRERWETRAESGATMFHATNSDFQRVEPTGTWLPHRCEVVSNAYETAPRFTSPEPLYATDIRIDTIERTNFSEEHFQIWYGRPGARITDYTNPRSTPSRPHTYVVASPLTETGPPLKNRWLLVIALNGIMAVILASVLYARSRQRERAGSGGTE